METRALVFYSPPANPPYPDRRIRSIRRTSLRIILDAHRNITHLNYGVEMHPLLDQLSAI